MGEGSKIPSESPLVSDAPSEAENSRRPSISVSKNPCIVSSIVKVQGLYYQNRLTPSKLPTIIPSVIRSRVPSSRLRPSSMVSGNPSHLPSSSTVPSKIYLGILS